MRGFLCFFFLLGLCWQRRLNASTLNFQVGIYLVGRLVTLDYILGIWWEICEGWGGTTLSHSFYGVNLL